MPNVRSVRVTYLYHSGFAVEVGRELLVFDYLHRPHATSLAQGGLSGADMARYDRVTVFISHAHSDHYDPGVFRWATSGNVRYVIGYDLPATAQGHRMSPGDALELGDMTVRAYTSTDVGVAYGVTLPLATVFHAGDLNWWHWRDESTLREIDEAETAFKAAIREIELDSIDVAFFPVDARQGTYFDVGAAWFAQEKKPKYLYPMHFGERLDAVRDFARRTSVKGVRIVTLLEPGESHEATWRA